MHQSKLKTILKTASEFKNSKWFGIFLIGMLMGGFIVLTSEVREALSGEAELISVIDHETLRFFVENRVHIVDTAAIDLTAMGSGVVLTILTIFICSYSLAVKRIEVVFQILMASLGASGLTWLLKFYFERSRPDASLRLVEVQGFSYPSGHSLAAAAIYFTVGVVLCKSIKSSVAKTTIWMLFLGLILSIGVSRIYLGVHYFSDVLAGILIGIAWASFVEFLVQHFWREV